MLARITCIAKRHHARADGGPDADADADADKDGTGELDDADEGGASAAAFASDAALESALLDGRMICCKYDDQLDRVDSVDDELLSAAAAEAAMAV